MGVKGLQATLNLFRTYPKRLQDDILDAVEETILLIQRQAIQNAPAAGERVATTYGTQQINTGINQFIGVEYENGGLTGKVFIEAGATELAVYLEFGTGASAAGYVPTLPAEFQRIAQLYYVNGRGTLIKHPFLLPAYFEHSPKLIEKIKVILRNAGN